MKQISIFKSTIAGKLAAVLAGLLVSVCMLSSCSSSDDGPSEAAAVTVSYETVLGNQPAPVSIPAGKELTSAELPELSADGYRFLGWYISTTMEGLEEIKIQPGYRVNSSIKLTAKWEKLTYFITYISEKGNYSRTVTVVPNSLIDDTLLAAPQITVEGYEFAGWYIGETKVTAGTVAVGENGIELTARWQLVKITLSYYTDFGVAPEPVTLDYGSCIEESHLKLIFASDCTFGGWYLNDVPAAAGTVLTKDTTLTAHWTVNGCPVVYRTEHGTAPKGLILAEGTVLQEEHLEPMSADGFRFLGWYIGVNKVEAGTITVTKAGVTLTAQWEPVQCKITYTTELSSAPAAKTVNWGTLLSSETLPELTCMGWTFKGWLLQGEPVTEGFKVTDSITLTASWEKMMCRITYESAYGSDIPEEASLEYGLKIPSSMLPDLYDPDDIWEFKGWCVKNAVQAEPLTGGTYTVEGHVTLTAIWECRTGNTGVSVYIYETNDFYLNWDQNWLEDRECYQYVFTVNENYTSYKWLMDGKTLSGWNSNSAVIYDDEYTDGMYTLTVIVTDSEGNRKSATAQVYID